MDINNEVKEPVRYLIIITPEKLDEIVDILNQFHRIVRREIVDFLNSCPREEEKK